MRGALVADQQVLAEIESREYSLITSSPNISNASSGSIDFGGSEVPMNDEELAKAPTKPLLLPSVVGVSRLSWKWRKRSSVKITERTYEKRAQALHC
jgi:hypothetical protein